MGVLYFGAELVVIVLLTIVIFNFIPFCADNATESRTLGIFDGEFVAACRGRVSGKENLSPKPLPITAG